MRLYALSVYLFLYIPIGVIALFSFNAGRNASQLQGFSTKWYGTALSNPFVMDALKTSLTVALTAAFLATVFGTMAAVALQGIRGPVRKVFDQLNPLIAAIWPEGVTPPKLNMGMGSLIAAHTMFLMALVIIIVRARLAGMDRALTEASSDLYATPFGTFRQVTLPLIFPAVLAGFLLSFTFSFDDFIIAFFVAGSETTLPIYVFSSIRRGVTPEINAIGTMILAVSLILLITAQIQLRRGARSGR